FYHYRQYDASELARTSTFESVWRLLVDGALPRDERERAAFTAEVAALRPIPVAADAAVSALAALDAPDAALRPAVAAIGAGRRISGFGHAVYRSTDPRSQLMSEVAGRLGGPRVAMARDVEATVLAELARRHPERRLVTNVEFWAAIVLEGSGVPRPLFTST